MAQGAAGSGWPRVSLHPTFLLVALLGLLAGRGLELAAIFSSVLVHELAHGVVAALCRLRIHRITLYPFGGVAEAPELAGAPAAARLLILAAGPAASLALFLGAAFLHESRVPLEVAGWVRVLEQANLGLLIANLAPVGPLDGGRILEVALERWMGLGGARRRILQAGVLAGIALSAGGALALAAGRPWGSLLLFGLFLAIASRREREGILFAVITWCLRGPRPVRVGPARLLVAPTGTRTREVASHLGAGPYRLVAVVEEGGRIRGILGEGEIARAMSLGAGDVTLEALLVPGGERAGLGGEGGTAARGGSVRDLPGSGGTGRTEEPL